MTIPKETAVKLCERFNQDRDELNYNDIDEILVINEECICTFEIFSKNEDIKEAFLFTENSDFFDWMGDNI